jgi:sugar phosphate permease
MALNLILSNLSPTNLIGATNGVSATFAACTQLIAPIASGVVFSATANFNRWPLNYTFTFGVCAIVCVVSLLGALRVQGSDVDKRRETTLE